LEFKLKQDVLEVFLVTPQLVGKDILRCDFASCYNLVLGFNKQCIYVHEGILKGL
jgi:hypothetical protein